jgi:hypothetical protein
MTTRRRFDWHPCPRCKSYTLEGNRHEKSFTEIRCRFGHYFAKHFGLPRHGWGRV